MEKNEGNIDRFIRVVLGGVLIIFGILGSGGWSTILIVVGLIPLVTGLIGWCPLYRIFGIKTCPTKSE